MAYPKTVTFLGAFGVFLLLFAVFFFGYLVGQGEFTDEQDRIQGILDSVSAKATHLLALFKKDKPAALEGTPTELQYQFYQQMTAERPKDISPTNKQEPLKRVFLEVRLKDSSHFRPLAEELKGLGLRVPMHPKQEGRTLKIGPFSSETEARTAKEKIMAKIRGLDMNIVKETEQAR